MNLQLGSKQVIGSCEALILSNLRLVAKIAKRYYSHGATLDDLIQEGIRGLIHAVDRYDPQTHNARFSTYATYWIRNKVQRAVAANYSLVRLPEYMFRLRIQTHQIDRERQIDSGVVPDDDGSAGLGPHLKTSHRQRHRLNHVLSPCLPYYGVDEYGAEANLAEILPDSSHPELDLERADELEELYEAIGQLTPVEAWLIRHRFGLIDPHEDSPSEHSLKGRARKANARPREWSYRRIARALGIPCHRIREVERVALEKLRSSLQYIKSSDGFSDCGRTKRQ